MATMGEQDEIQTPDYRATISDGQMNIVRWAPRLMRCWGPASAHFRSRAEEGVSIADLTVLRNSEAPYEVIVKFLAGGESPDAREAIVKWATTLGYGRVWLPGDVVELEDRVMESAVSASVDCHACNARWEDGDPDFWLCVRNLGNFPLYCPLCGADLPQWQIASQEAAA